MKVDSPKSKLFSGKKRLLEVIHVLGPHDGLEPLPDEDEEAQNGLERGNSSGDRGGPGGDNAVSPQGELRTQEPADRLEPPPPPTSATALVEKKETNTETIPTPEEPAKVTESPKKRKRRF